MIYCPVLHPLPVNLEEKKYNMSCALIFKKILPSTNTKETFKTVTKAQKVCPYFPPSFTLYSCKDDFPTIDPCR